MREDIQERLLTLNQSFYQTFADPFAGTRQRPQPGFQRLVEYIPAGRCSVLDVGCGEGRFGRFLKTVRPGMDYVGVDASPALLRHAARAFEDAVLLQRDVSRPGSLDDLGRFDLVVCLAVLQHIPGHERRASLLSEMRQRLAPDGQLFLSTWQFMQSARQRRKLMPWSAVGLSEKDVEPHDHLVAWRTGGTGMRYVAYIDQQELEGLARWASLSIVNTFRSDGREGNLNLYAVLRRADDPQESARD